QLVRFGFKQRVQRLLHAPSHDPVEVALDPLVVNRDDIVQRTRCSLGHGGSFSPTWLRFATSSSATFGAARPTYLRERFCTSSAGEVRNVSLLVAIGVSSEGYREVLGICEGAEEERLAGARSSSTSKNAGSPASD